MADKNIIKKFLPQHLRNYALKFDIPEDVLEEYYDLIQLILESKAIDTDEEKQNWINLLLLMTDEQIEKLRQILLKEKKKLQEIEEKYERKKLEIKKKYLEKWQKMWYIKKIKEIHSKELAEKTKEEEEAEKLLNLI